MDAKKLGDFIAQRRKELGLTQALLAEQLHVTDKAVSRWERGVGLPDIGSMEALAQALDVSLVELMRAERSEAEQISRAEADQLLVEALHLSERPVTAYFAKGMLIVCLVAAVPLLFLLFGHGRVVFFNVGSLLLGFTAWSIPLVQLSRIWEGGNAACVVSFALALASLALQFFEIGVRVDAGDWSALMDTIHALKTVVIFFSSVTLLLNIAAVRFQKHRSKRLAAERL